VEKPSVCHLTSVHKQFDIRIFYKELVSLSKAGYKTTLISQGVSGKKEGIKLIGLGKAPKSRIKRILFFTKKLYRAAINVNADIYHIHDPELLPIGKKLSQKGKIVIFDSHENVPGQIEEKTYIPKILRTLISNIYASYEKRIVKKLSGIICVSPNFSKRMKQNNSNTVTVTNYPLLSEQNELIDINVNNEINIVKSDDFTICFPGLISEEWCHLELLDAIDDLEIAYLLCGPKHEEYFQKIKLHNSWEKVNYLGVVSRERVIEIINNSDLGIALCRKLPNTDYNVGTLGNTKLFEYMLQKKPVCCTNFDLWQEIVVKNNCGICVEPDNPNEIKKALEWFIDHPKEGVQMGERGYNAVITEYNWASQEKKLLDFYEKIYRTNH